MKAALGDEHGANEAAAPASEVEKELVKQIYIGGGGGGMIKK